MIVRVKKTSGERQRGSPKPNERRRGLSEPHRTWLAIERVDLEVQTPLDGSDRGHLGFSNVVEARAPIIGDRRPQAMVIGGRKNGR